MPSSSAPGRRRAPRPTLGARIATVISPRVALKSVAALGMVGIATASVIVPASGDASSVSTPAIAAASSTAATARLGAISGASRSSERLGLAATSTSDAASADAAAPGSTVGAPTAAAQGAVAAPARTTPETVDAVGVSGFAAVAKPPVETNLDKGAPAAESGTSEPLAAVGQGYSSSAFAGWCGGLGLGWSATAVCSDVRSLFGISNIGGYRAGDSGDHGAGMAVDVMVGDFGTGDAIAAFLQAHSGEFRIKYLIWKQRYWAPGGSWSMMEDRGSPTQNHYDHVHISVY